MSASGETHLGDLAPRHGGTRTRATASDFGAGGRVGRCSNPARGPRGGCSAPALLVQRLKDAPARPSSRCGERHAQRAGAQARPGSSPRLPSAFLTRNPEAKKKQPFGRRVSIHSPVRLSVHCLHAHLAPTLWPALAGTPVPGRRDCRGAPRRARQQVRQSQESLAVSWDRSGPAAHPRLGAPGYSMRMKTGHLHLSKTSSSAPCPRAGGAQPPTLLASHEHQRGLGQGVPPRH